MGIGYITKIFYFYIKYIKKIIKKHRKILDILRNYKNILIYGIN